MVLSDYLSGQGYRVLQAENGEQAFEILASKPHLDVLITDFRLPGGISGVQIAEPAVKLRPELKVIFISGYPQEIRETAVRSPARRRSSKSRSIWTYCRKRFRNCWPDTCWNG
jgi:two-component system cell cycle response regulator CpdR